MRWVEGREAGGGAGRERERGERERRGKNVRLDDAA